MAAELKLNRCSAIKLATRLTLETFMDLPIWQVTLQVRHEGTDFDPVYTIRWPSVDSPDIAVVMNHWSRYPRQFQFVAYLPR